MGRIQITPARVAAFLTGLSGLAAAIAPMVANLDTTSVAAEGAGLLAILVVALKFIDGAQKHEAREHELKKLALMNDARPAGYAMGQGANFKADDDALIRSSTMSRYPLPIPAAAALQAVPDDDDEPGDVHALPNVAVDEDPPPDEGNPEIAA